MSMHNRLGESPSSKIRLAWIDSMLNSLNPQDEEERILRLLKQLDQPKHSSPAASNSRFVRGRSIPWRSLAIATLVLIAVLIGVYDRGSRSAMAAVSKSLQEISKLQTRQYDMLIMFDDPDLGEFTTQNDVFVEGLDRFAVRNAGPVGDVWLGHNGGDEYWILPPFENLIRCDSQAFYAWIDSRRLSLKLPRSPRNTPFLHVASSLEILSDRCHIKELPRERIPLPDGQTIECRHIRGMPRGQQTLNPPESIDLWISQEFDIPIQVIARWSESPEADLDQSRIQAIQLIYRGQPEVAEDWFEPESHLNLK